MEKHYVVFFSPGTFVAEQTQKEIDDWDIEKAKKIARSIKERHGATPYGFQFVTRKRGEKDFDSKETKRSGTYYLGGKIWTLDELKARNDPKDSILISNMNCNGWPRVVENNNSWKWMQPLRDDDEVLAFEV